MRSESTGVLVNTCDAYCYLMSLHRGVLLLERIRQEARTGLLTGRLSDAGSEMDRAGQNLNPCVNN
jgi:hypothetical protein